MSEERKTIYLCLAHMSDEGFEQKYVKEAFDTNWVVPMGPNVNAFEEDLRKFVTGNVESAVYQDSRWPEATAALGTDAKPSANELARFAEVRRKSTISQVTEPFKEEILKGTRLKSLVP